MRKLLLVLAFVIVSGLASAAPFDLVISDGANIPSIDVFNTNVLMTGGEIGQFVQTCGGFLITGGTIGWLVHFADYTSSDYPYDPYDPNSPKVTNEGVEIWGGNIGMVGTNQPRMQGPYYIHYGDIFELAGMSSYYLYGYDFEREVVYYEDRPTGVMLDRITGYWADSTPFSIKLGTDDGWPNAWYSLHLITVPEPSAILLLGAGLIGLALYGRKEMS